MSRAERLLDLMMYLIDSPQARTAAEIRSDVEGYDPAAGRDAFARMFERDKDDLRAAGVPILVETAGTGEAAYRIDRDAYLLPPLSLDSRELAAVALAAQTLAADPGFPMGDELRLAFLKLSTRAAAPAPRLAVRLLGPGSGDESQAVARLVEAIRRRKRVAFRYQAIGADSPTVRTVRPFGLFYAPGAWYLVGHDEDRGSLRTFRAGRIVGGVEIAKANPQKADFEVPDGFEIEDYQRHPLQIGAERVPVTVRFAPRIAWLAQRRTAGMGEFSYEDDGSGIWQAEVADGERLLAWVSGFGPAAELLFPPALRARMADRLEAMLASSGGAGEGP